MNFKKKLAINIVQNLVFWTISFVITLRVFAQTEQLGVVDFIYSFLFHIPFVTVVLFNIYRFIPDMLVKYGVWAYIGMILVPGYGITLSLYGLSYGMFSDFLFPNYFMVGSFMPHEIFGIMAVYLAISSMIEFSKSWFGRKETELKLAQLQEEKTFSELKALRAQINPHFLFNNLNTIYGEALKKSEKAPSMILKLSSILRYIVENMDKDIVPLSAEIEYLKEFINLQKERISNPRRVAFSVHGKFDDLSIAPLLLVNFVENAFKHGSTTEETDQISFNLSVMDKTLTFRSVNTKSNSRNLEATSSGTGIQNVKKRLDLLYADRHSLEIKEDNYTYDVTLSLRMK
ncbi:MAG: hypothetical protein ED557_11035 [Balneola sp.]|nr:MAG: hypothetical protein ED557_11035 [Balneola sp.]